MSFPTIEVINTWFQNAHATAVAAGGSVYVMEKRAEQEVANSAIRWAYLNMLDELVDLNYPIDSRVRVRVVEMLNSLYNAGDVDDIEDEEEFVDDYNDDEDEDTNKDETTSEEPSIVVDTDLAIEIVGALLKAITSK